MISCRNIFKKVQKIGLLTLILTCCTSKKIDPQDPKDSYSSAKEFFDQGNYDLAIQKLGEFKSRFPYSNYAILADLYIADSYFELEEFSEAVVSYSQFAKLHPSHFKADYAMFRVGESYWTDAPLDVDREQDLTIKAISSWNKLIKQYPASPYVKKAQQSIKKGHERIAKSYEFIAKFYCKMEKYHACAFKYLQIVRNYPDYKLLYQNALKNAAIAFDKLYQMKKISPDSDKNLYFKNLTIEELKKKAEDLRTLLAESVKK